MRKPEVESENLIRDTFTTTSLERYQAPGFLDNTY